MKCSQIMGFVWRIFVQYLNFIFPNLWGVFSNHGIGVKIARIREVDVGRVFLVVNLMIRNSVWVTGITKMKALTILTGDKPVIGKQIKVRIDGQWHWDETKMKSVMELSLCSDDCIITNLMIRDSVWVTDRTKMKALLSLTGGKPKNKKKDKRKDEMR